MKKIISVKKAEFKKDSQELDTHFDIVDSNCDLKEAEIVCFLERLDRFDGDLVIQLMINNLAKDEDLLLSKNENDSDQFILGTDPKTILLKPNLITKGWDTKAQKERLELLDTKIEKLQNKILTLRPDIKNQTQKRFKQYVMVGASLNEFKNGQKKSDILIDQLHRFNAQEIRLYRQMSQEAWQKTISKHHTPGHRTFILINEIMYPSTPQRKQHLQNKLDLCDKSLIEQAVDRQIEETRPIQQFLEKYNYVVLSPKYHQTLSIPSVSIKEDLLDQQIAALCKSKMDTQIKDQAVKNLYALKKEPDTKDHTLLELAAKHNLGSTLQFLLDKKLDNNNKKSNGNTPLHFASLYLQKNALSILLAKNASINDSNQSGKTPLHLALNTYEDRNLSSIITEILKKDSSETTTIKIDASLLNPTQYIHIREKNKKDQLAIIQLLLDHQADPNHSDNLGITPLMSALQSRADYAVVDLLLKKGADPNKTNKDGQNSLQIAIEHHNTPAIIERLIQSNISITEKGRGFTPIELAIRNQDEAVVRLLTKKVDWKTVDDPDSLLEIAVNFSTPEICRILLEFNNQIFSHKIKKLIQIKNINDEIKRILEKALTQAGERT